LDLYYDFKKGERGPTLITCTENLATLGTLADLLGIQMKQQDTPPQSVILTPCKLCGGKGVGLVKSSGYCNHCEKKMSSLK